MLFIWSVFTCDRSCEELKISLPTTSIQSKTQDDTPTLNPRIYFLAAHIWNKPQSIATNAE